MSGRRFLKGLKDTTLPEKTIKTKSLLKEGIDIDENVKTTNESAMVKLESIFFMMSTH